tara:strand:- start:2787 stop:3032 length:246 start_codon:yes stop_codon:yes gene_type:complete
MSDAEKTKTSPKKFRKGDLIRVNRAAYENSVEANSSDQEAPDYIFEGPGELLLVKDEYCQVRWRRPVPDVWLRIDQLEPWS